jgi:hypothetical protein
MCANGFSIVCLPFIEKNSYKILLASLETLTISKDCSERCIIFPTVFGRFFLVYIHGRLSEQLLGSYRKQEQAS